MNDTAAVTALFDSVASAWERADLDAFGRAFTADATYTTFIGTHYRGRTDIVEAHRVLLAKFLRGTRQAGETIDVRFYGPDTAIVTSRGDLFKGVKAPAKLTKVQTSTVVREADGQWRIAAFHNTKRRPLLEAFSFWSAPATRPTA